MQRLRVCEIGEELAPGSLVAIPAVEIERSLALRVRDEVVHRREATRLLLRDCPLCLVEPRFAAARLDPALHRGLRLVVPEGESACKDEPPHARAVRSRVSHCDHPAVREAEQIELLDAEMLAQRLDVGGVRGERVVVRGVRAGRPARTEE